MPYIDRYTLYLLFVPSLFHDKGLKMMANNASSQEIVRSSRAAQRKLKLYEQLLGLRIQLQKPIQLMNKLPPVIKEDGEYKTLTIGVVDEEVSSAMRGVLSDVCELSGVKSTAFNSAVHHTDEDLNNIWSGIIAHQQKQYNSLWRPVLDKMHDKTLLSGGVKAQSLKVFHTSFWNKIDNVLADDNKALEKSRPLATESVRIGISDCIRDTREDDSLDPDVARSLGLLKPREISDEHDDDEEEDNKRRVGHKAKRSVWRDGEVFEDSACYAILLKSFLQSAASGSNLAGQDLAALRQLKRRKSNVDRKASKGRKIRYVVHSKLENFMFPTPLGNETTALAFDSDRLFKSLFQ